MIILIRDHSRQLIKNFAYTTTILVRRLHFVFVLIKQIDKINERNTEDQDVTRILLRTNVILILFWILKRMKVNPPTYIEQIQPELVALSEENLVVYLDRINNLIEMLTPDSTVHTRCRFGSRRLLHIKTNNSERKLDCCVLHWWNPIETSRTQCFNTAKANIQFIVFQCINPNNELKRKIVWFRGGQYQTVAYRLRPKQAHSTTSVDQQQQQYQLCNLAMRIIVCTTKSPLNRLHSLRCAHTRAARELAEALITIDTYNLCSS